MPDDDETISVVQADPLVLLITLPDGCTPGRWEAAESFAQSIAELREKYPGVKFQFIPFGYEIYKKGHYRKSAISSMLAHAEEVVEVRRRISQKRAEGLMRGKKSPTEVSEIGLEPRTLTTLMIYEIKTTDDVKAWINGSNRKMAGLGRKSKNDLIHCLDTHGFKDLAEMCVKLQ